MRVELRVRVSMNVRFDTRVRITSVGMRVAVMTTVAGQCHHLRHKINP